MVETAMSREVPPYSAWCIGLLRSHQVEVNQVVDRLVVRHLDPCILGQDIPNLLDILRHRQCDALGLCLHSPNSSNIWSVKSCTRSSTAFKSAFV